MLPFWLTTFALVGAQQAPSPCTLAGPTVEARWTGTVPRAATAAAPLQLVADHPLPGTTSRFDYQSLEPDAGRLFISHMGAGQLVVFDVRAGRVIGNLDGFERVTGVLAVPAEHRAYASAAGAHAVMVVNDSTFKIVARIPGPSFPDGIAYAPIELGGEAGNTQYDSTSHCVIFAVQTANQLAVIDPATATIVRRITLDRAVRYPHGVYLDAAHRLAFIAGQESATLGVLDLQTLQLRP